MHTQIDCDLFSLCPFSAPASSGLLKKKKWQKFKLQSLRIESHTSVEEYLRWTFINTYPFVKGGKKLDVRLEVFSSLVESFVI
jgi:hypothetical protein